LTPPINNIKLACNIKECYNFVMDRKIMFSCEYAAKYLLMTLLPEWANPTLSY